MTVSEIVTEASIRNLTVGELFAIPENDDWYYYIKIKKKIILSNFNRVYSDGKSLVCSSFGIFFKKKKLIFNF